MSHYFTNENKDVTNTTQNYGVVPAQMDPAKIDDHLKERGAALGKLGSSMPTPMARLFLFEAALAQVNSFQEADNNNGHNGIFDPNTQAIKTTPYHDLVGELLDMIEFTFLYGDDPRFTIETWDPAVACRKLRATGLQSHAELADAIESAFSFGKLQGKVINLFKWDKKVVGGTSPVTFVYTSANLRSTFGPKEFKGGGDYYLFTDEPKPLHKRSAAFREYLYRLRHDLTDGSLATDMPALARYLVDSGSKYDQALYQPIPANPTAYRNTKLLKSSTTQEIVKVGGIKMRTTDHTVDATNSAYRIKPTKTGNAPDGKVPLMLTRAGMDRCEYVNGRPWNPATDRIPDLLDSDITKRALPGCGRMDIYPYLVIDDLLEKTIIEVPYQINRRKFFTGSFNHEVSFLLPLKKKFFEYFQLSDLFKVSVQGELEYTDMLTLRYDNVSRSVSVTLRVPLVDNRTIEVERVYKREDTLTCIDPSFDMAFMPFYRLQPDLSGNVYNLFAVSNVEAIDFKFYEPVDQAYAGADTVESNAARRSKVNAQTLRNTDHIHIDGAFSIAEMSITNAGRQATALILPIFKTVSSNVADAPNKFYFSIDFGTTNTHVSYYVDGQGQNGTVRAFEYGPADAQCVTFNNGGAGVDETFVQMCKREFMPLTIGKEHKSKVSFPITTTTAQKEGQLTELNMFEHTNIGFNYIEDRSHENQQFDNTIYKIDIKWDMFDNLAPRRMSAFFQQILWMMKNKSVLNGGSAVFDLVVTYPLAMRRSDLALFKNAWNDAVAKVHSQAHISFLPESVAPYYDYLARIQAQEPYVNMDIGGGTTDILYVDAANNESYQFSAMFAGNDLWNGGINEAELLVNNLDNGFIKYFDAFSAMDDAKRAVFNNILRASSKSTEVINSLFRSDNTTNATSLFSRSHDMMQLPIIHFSALIFYLGYTLYQAAVQMPTRLTFTGMGSKYLHMISASDRDLQDLVNAVLHHCGELFDCEEMKRANVTVQFAENPKEVTANGALVSLNHAHPINPSIINYMCYADEDVTAGSLHYGEINEDKRDKTARLFTDFLALFRRTEVCDVLSDMGHRIDPGIVSRFADLAKSSFSGMKGVASKGQAETDRVTQPIFFWCVKQSLYIIGKEIAQNAIDHKAANQ